MLLETPALAGGNIYTASVLGEAATVGRFLESDPKLAQAKGGPHGWDALTYLCFSQYLRLDAGRSEGFVEAAKALLEAGASANTGWFEKAHQPKPEWESVLYGAAGVAHHTGLTRLLLAHGADPNDGEVTYHAPEGWDNAVLKALVETGKLTADSLATMLLRKHDWHDLEGVTYLLEHGADPNRPTHWGKTAFHQAVQSDNEGRIIEALLEHGGDPTLTTDRSERSGHLGTVRSAVAMAARRGRRDVLESFERRGIDFKLTGAERLVAACAMDREADIAKFAGEEPRAVEELRADGGRLLAGFAGVGNTSGIRRLLDLGVPVEAIFEEGEGYFGVAPNSTALHVAAWRLRAETVALLIERGAEVNRTDGHARTPLMLAVRACVDSYWTERRSPETVAALLEAGADVRGVKFPSDYELVDDLLRPRVQATAERIQRMIRPDALKRDEPLLWSTGTGVEVWNMIGAAIIGDVVALRRMLEKNPALAHCHYHYRTPLYFAVRENQLEAVRLLLERGTDPLALAVNDSLLEITRDRGYAELEQFLKTSLAQTHNASPKGEPVAAAIRERDLAKVRELLDATPELLHQGDERSNQPIHWATMTRQPEVIDELLRRGANIEAKRIDGARPIHLFNGDYHYRGWRDVPEEATTTPAEVLAHLRTRGAYCDIWTACHVGDIERVRELLQQDSSLANRLADCVTYYLGSGSPLRNAAARGHLAIVKLLLAYGADPKQPEPGIAPRGHALYSAVYHRHLEVARVLLEHGAPASAPVESSADALSIALSHKDEPMVELLCSYGAARSVDLLGHDGDVRTAAAVFAANPKMADDVDGFNSAAGNGHEALVRLMLRYQPDLTTRTGAAGKTPELTELLFRHGMNASHPDWLRITPLHEFARQNDLPRARQFLAHGADVHARDEDIRSTPLGWAAKFGKIEMVQLLLEHGARPNHPDDPPWATPLAWATRRGHAAIADVLREQGATA